MHGPSVPLGLSHLACCGDGVYLYVPRLDGICRRCICWAFVDREMAFCCCFPVLVVGSLGEIGETGKGRRIPRPALYYL